MKKIFYILTALLLIGCKCQPIIETIEKERIVEVHTRDTAIVTQADSASLRALLRCDSAYNVVLYDLVCLQGERIDATAHTQKSGKELILSLDCKEDSLAHIIQLRDSVIKDLERQAVVVRERYVPNYYKNTSRGFWVLFVILLLIVAWWGFKIYRKIVTGQIVWRL